MFVNDFLSESDFKELENLFDNPQFSWYKQTGVSYNKGDSLFSGDGIYFNHLAYRNGKIMREVFPYVCLLYKSTSPRDPWKSRMPCSD